MAPICDEVIALLGEGTVALDGAADEDVAVAQFGGRSVHHGQVAVVVAVDAPAVEAILAEADLEALLGDLGGLVGGSPVKCDGDRPVGGAVLRLGGLVAEVGVHIEETLDLTLEGLVQDGVLYARYGLDLDEALKGLHVGVALDLVGQLSPLGEAVLEELDDLGVLFGARVDALHAVGELIFRRALAPVGGTAVVWEEGRRGRRGNCAEVACGGDAPPLDVILASLALCELLFFWHAPTVAR